MFTSTGSNSTVVVIRHGGELRLRRLSDMDKPASDQVANDVTVKGLDNPQARWPCINSTAQHQLISPLSHPIIPMADPAVRDDEARAPVTCVLSVSRRTMRVLV